jgi:hypothetical protein
VEAQKQYSGDGIAVTPTVDGARLRAVFQKLEGQATPEGMWLESTAEGNDQPERFRLLAIAQGRTAAPSSAALLDRTGKVQVTRDAALFVRPGLLEEYSVSMDGVRQDFVVLECPVGAGTLNVTLEVTGARVAVAPYGAKLTLQGSGREIAYSRLHVTDAKGRVLSAHFEVAGANLLQVRVDDAEAVYPVRIDPTFSDADWFSMGGIRGVGGEVHAIATDTAGNVYIGGSFSALGNAKINGIAKWDGSAWSPLASGVNGQVNALLVSGTDLYAGGNFTTAGGVMVNRIAKWNGSTWSALGSGMDSSVAALAISGTDLYAGGSFSMAGGATVNHIAKWNGTTWDALGTGLNNDVAALAVSGSSLYAGGKFTAAGAVSANNIAKWNGSVWSALGLGMSGGNSAKVLGVHALAVSGVDLYAAGNFEKAGGVTVNNIAKWNGSAWSAMGSGTSSPSEVNALAVSGTDVFIGGDFIMASGVMANNIAKWNGANWSALASEVSGGLGGVYALAAVGTSVYVGGDFTMAGAIHARGIANWSGTAWGTLGAVTPVAMNDKVCALAVSGTDIYAGGYFTTAGGVKVNSIAKWNGSAWSALGTGIGGEYPYVNALAVSGTNLYVGGYFTKAGGVAANNVAKWNGSAWSALGTGVTGVDYAYVNALAVSGTSVYVGGFFSTAGAVAANNIAKWSGTAWSALGAGVNGDFPYVGDYRQVYALAVSGTKLYVGGDFSSAGGLSANGIAQWNGSAWSVMGSGFGGDFPTVYALAVSGTDLYAGGDFTTAGGVLANYIAKWNGSAWSALGSGLDNWPLAMLMAGTDLYVGGSFSTAGGLATNCMAKWNGSTWSALGSGMDSPVAALAMSGTDLYAGGFFTLVGGKVSGYIARGNLAGPIPEMAISGNGIGIVSGDSAPNLADNTDFSSTGVSGGTTVGVFTIASIGSAELTLTGTPKVVIGGANAADFVVTAQPMSPIAAVNGITTFEITFDPSTTGTRTATVSIANDDPNENPYTFSIQGTGVAPEIAVLGNGMGIASGDTTPNLADHTDFGSAVLSVGSMKRTFTIANLGAVELTLSGTPSVVIGGVNAADFSITAEPVSPIAAGDGSTTFEITFEPSAAGSRSATISIANDDSNETPYTFSIRGMGTTVDAPEILVELVGGTSLTDGSGSIDFGSVYKGTPSANKTFTIANIGTRNLTGISVVMTGANASEFLHNAASLLTSLVPGDSANFTVRLKPAADGLRSAALQITSDDADENPFDIALTGTGTSIAAEIGITGNNAAIVDGDTTPSAADHTDFGAVLANGATLIRTFTIANTGKGVLHLTGSPLVEITGDHATDFAVTADPGGTVPLAGKTTFKITFDPQALGLRTAIVSIANDDPDENPYTFAIAGVGTELPRDFSTLAGSYNGLVKASNLLPEPAGTVPSASTEGFFTAALVKTGVFTGKLTLDGLVLSVAGAFDNTGVARFGANLATSLTVARTGKPSLMVALSLDLDPPPDAVGKLTGTVTQSNRSIITAVSTVEAERSHYNGSTVVVDDDYLTVKGSTKSDGIYTVLFRTRAPYDEMDPENTQVEGLAAEDYPQGTGIATAKISKAGVVSLAGTLADGTVFTASTLLSQANRSGLFVPLYKMAGFVSGWLELDNTEDDSDFSVAGLSWCRPYQDTQHYPFGWPEIIKTDLSAAKYIASPGQSTLPNVVPTAITNIANADLEWSGGLLELPESGAVNLSPADVVSKVPVTDSRFALAMTRGTGLVSGNFTHSDGTKPAFQGVVYQKGTLVGGWGFFLTTTPKVKDFTGQSGLMTLKPNDGASPLSEFLVSASFSESYRETLKGTTLPDMGGTFYEEIPSGATSFTVVGILNQGALNTIGEDTGVGVAIGSFTHSGIIGEANVSSVAGRRAVFYLTAQDPSDPEGMREIRTGTITYIWTATSVTVTGSLTLDGGNVAAQGYGDLPGPVSSSVDAELNFGEVTGTRKVHITGTSTQTVRNVGTVEFPDEYTLSNVSINGSTDYVKPVCAITVPANAGRVLASSGSEVLAGGSASDGFELGEVLVRLNGGDWAAADLAFKQIGKDESGEPRYSIAVATWSLAVTPLPGPNFLEAKATDGDGNESVIGSRTFMYVVPSPLQITPDGQGSVTNGFGGSTQREVGASYTVTAMPKAGFVFDLWEVGGGASLEDIGVRADDLQNPVLKFIFVEGLVLTAKFIANPFIAVAGNYNGLVQASKLLPDPDGTVSGVSTEGFLNAAVLNTGAFTGKLTLDGLVLNVAGTFDNTGMARFGVNRERSLTVARTDRPSIEVALNLDVTAPPANTGKLTGTVTQHLRSMITAVSDVETDRAYFNGTTVPVPDDYLTVKGTSKTDGIFTAFFAPQEPSSQSPGLTTTDYPQGKGFATIKVSKAGLVSLAGTLADGTAITASAPLSEAKTWPLFAQLYNKGGFISGQVALSIGAASDLSAMGLLWFRPFMDVQHYPYGWPECIKVDFLGAKYAVPANASVLPGLPIADADGNAVLTFTDGLLADPVSKQMNLTTADVATKIPATDATYTLTINRTTGMMTGTFTHTDGTKPSFQGIIYQKAGSPHSGGHGFFLTPIPAVKDYTGESGGVTLLAE